MLKRRRSARIGIAQALATEEQVRAYGGPQFQVTQTVLSRFAEAIQQSGVDVVPRILIGGQDGSNGNLMEALMAMLLSERLNGERPIKRRVRRKPRRC